MKNSGFWQGGIVALIIWILYAVGVPVLSDIAKLVLAATFFITFSLPLWGPVLLMLSTIDDDAWKDLMFGMGYTIALWLGMGVRSMV